MSEERGPNSHNIYEGFAITVKNEMDARQASGDALLRLAEHQRDQIEGISRDLESSRMRQAQRHEQYDARYKAIEGRVNHVEIGHQTHSARLGKLEQKYTDTNQVVRHLSDQQKWMASAVTGLAILGGLGTIWWFLS